MKNVLLFIVVLFSFTCASAQHWYPSPAPNGRDINAIKILHPDTVILAGGWKIDHVDTSSALFLSYNGGLYLWNVPAFPNVQHWCTSVDFTDSQNGIAVGDGGYIAKTADGGWNWTSSSTPLNRDLNKIYPVDAQNMFLVGGRESDSLQSPMQTIFRSTNGGQSWSVVLDQPGFWLKSVFFLTANTGYAVGDSGTILKTIDGGSNWNPVTPPIQRNFNAIWFKDANNGFIAGGYPANDSIRTILQTTNGGNTWTINLDQIGSMLRDIHFADANTGYAVGDDASVYKTTNGGQGWNPITIPGTAGDEQFNAVRFYNTDFGYVSGKQGKQYIYNTEAAPEAFTSGAIVTDSSATLTGFVNSHNEIAAYGFVFSPDFSAGSFETPYKGGIENDTPAFVSETFTHLLPDTQYYYFFEAFTKGGHVRGDTLTFHTGNTTEQIVTQGATSISQDSATLNGSIKGFSFPMNLFFEYGTTPAFGSQIAATPPSVNDTFLHLVAAVVSSLQNNRLYYFRLKGVSGTTNYYGNTQVFLNGPKPLFTVLQTLSATSVLDTGATLNAVVEGFLIPADISFEYSANNMSFNLNTLPVPQIVDTLQHQASAIISNLTPATLYYFRTKALTTLGVFYGDTLRFFTRLPGNYTVKTNAATDVTGTFAQLHGEVNTLPEPVDLSFEYGTTLAMSNIVQSTPASISDTGAYAITADLTGLQPNTLYYYRLNAEIASGVKLYGDVRQVYTGYNPIPNWDFQQWEQRSYSIPERWNIMSDDYERVPGHSGNYALKIAGTALATLGFFYDSGSDRPAFAGGVPFHARPDSISFYANYNLEAGDSALVLIYLYDTAYNDICTGFFSIGGNSNGQFKRLSFAIPYNSGLMPDTLGLGFLAANPESSITSNSYLIIDDIMTSASSSVIPFGDLESWVDLSSLELTGWLYPKHVILNSVQPPIISQAIFNSPDDYAAEMQNFSIGNNKWVGAEVSNKRSFFDKDGGFPVYARHQTLNGYIKWLPENGDTLHISVSAFYQGQNIGDGQVRITTAIPDFTAFDIPINYQVSGVTPDTAQISFRCYNRAIPKGESHLFIDKLSFDGFVGIKENKFISGNTNETLTIYPNPASSEVVIQLNTAIPKGTLKVYDLHGIMLRSKEFSGNSVVVDIREFTRGLYLASIEQDKNRITSRFIVIK